MNYIWPIALVIISNLVYHITAKSSPSELNPFAGLTITYSVGAVTSLILYFLLNKKADILTEFSHLNWAPFALGVAIVGLEAGYLYAYKNGWAVGSAQIVQSSILAVALIVVGALLFRERITWNKIIGIIICLIGLVFINLK